MRDQTPRHDPTPDSAAAASARAADDRAVEAAAIRRRWITLGEGLAAIAVSISALTLWNSWSERSAGDAARTVDARAASAHAATLVLVATRTGDRKLSLRPASPAQSVQSQTISFPAALGVAPVDITGDSRVEAGWFEHALKNARGAAHLPADSRGDERLPVVISTRFLVDGEPHRDVALYDVGYGIIGHWFGGHGIVLHGVSLVARVTPDGAQAGANARWTRLLARKP